MCSNFRNERIREKVIELRDTETGKEEMEGGGHWSHHFTVSELPRLLNVKGVWMV